MTNKNLTIDNGFIKVHRRILNWEWYDDINTKILFIHLILKANYIDKNWHGVEVKRGSLITSLPNLSKEVCLSVQQTRTSLNKLKSTHEITVYSTNNYSLITITCYDDYQSINTQYNNQSTDEQQTSNRRATITKENKEGKEIEEKYISLANMLRDTVESKFSIKCNTNNWAKIISLMEKRDKIDYDRIKRGIEWLNDIALNPYTPTIQSADALRRKFINLENAIEREKEK